MKVALASTLIFLQSIACAFSFTEALTGLEISIPDSFSPNSSSTDVSEFPIWYSFQDEKENILIIEIDPCHEQLHPREHVYKKMTDADYAIDDSMVFDELEFSNQTINGLEITKLKMRLFDASELADFYFCDYLLVRNQFDILISLIKKEKGPEGSSDSEQVMDHILQSIRFVESPAPTSA